MKILVVDDSKAMRMIVSRALRQSGYGDHERKEAGDGQQGLDVVHEWNPDVILSDWNMPVMNGLEFLQALKAEGYAGRFGFITSEGSAKIQGEAMESGADFIITKPFTGDAFKNALGDILG